MSSAEQQLRQPRYREPEEGALVRATSEMFRPYGLGRVQKVKNGIVKVEFSQPNRVR